MDAYDGQGGSVAGQGAGNGSTSATHCGSFAAVLSHTNGGGG